MIDKSKLKLIISLMGIAAIIIIALAVFVFINFSHMDLSQGIILGIIGVVALFIIMIVFIVFIRSFNSGKKPAGNNK